MFSWAMVTKDEDRNRNKTAGTISRRKKQYNLGLV
jgi:hypothetical protein